MGLTGLPDLPCKTGPAIADATSGLTAAVGLLASLWGRERHGEGAYLDIAMVDALFACLENTLASYDIARQIPSRQANVDHVLAPFDCFCAANGWIVIGVGNDPLWSKLAALIQEGLAADPRFLSNSDRVTHYHLLRPIIAEWCQPQTVKAALSRLHAAGIPSGAVRTLDELACDTRLEARGMLARLSLAGDVSLLVPGTPIQIAETETRPYHRAPRLGEHTQEILSEQLGLSCAEMLDYVQMGVAGVESREELQNTFQK